MQVALGWVFLILGGALYLAQVISSVNFELAQRLGIQENPQRADSLLQRSERYTAYWDLLVLGWLPLAGALMVMDHKWWPIVSLIGASVYLDASGREAAKTLSFRREGLAVGTDRQQKIFFASYVLMAVMAVVSIAYSVSALVSMR